MKAEDVTIGDVIFKAYGHEIVLVNSPFFCGKKLVIEPGFRTSIHRHLVKNEAFIVESGSGWASLGREVVELLPGRVLIIPAREWHSVWNAGPERLVILEVSSHHDDADVERETKSGPLRRLPLVPMVAPQASGEGI